MTARDIFKSTENPNPDLLLFYGRECRFTRVALPFIECAEQRLKEEGYKRNEITKHEIWHDNTHHSQLTELGNGKCNGVPFFVNPQTGDYVCGAPRNCDILFDWAITARK